MCFIASFAIFFYFVVITASFSYFIGLCIQVKAMMHDMEMIMLKVNAHVSTNLNKRLQVSTKGILAEGIQFHNAIIE